MSDFNFDEFSKKLASIQEGNYDKSTLTPKQREVDAATERKYQHLKNIQKIEQLNATESMAGRLGLDHKGIVGEQVNRLTATANDAARHASNLLQLPDDANAYYQAATTDPWANLAQIEEDNGTESERNSRLLDQRVNIFGQKEGVSPLLDMLGTSTNREKIESAKNSIKRAKYLEDTLNLDHLVPTDIESNKKESGVLSRLVGDTAIGLVDGAVSVPEAFVGLGDIVSKGKVGKFVEDSGINFKGTHELLSSYLTPEQQKADAEVINTEGFQNTLYSIAHNPSTVKQFLAQSLPSMWVGGVIGGTLIKGGSAVAKASPTAQKLLNTKVGGALAKRGTGLSVGLGEGLMMGGSTAESIRQQSEDGYLTGKQALLAAGVIPVGAAVGYLGGKAATKLGFGDIETAVAKGKLPKLSGSTTANVAGSAGIEALEEGFQTLSETVSENIALDREWDEGLGNALAIGTTTGATLGAPAGLATANKNKEDLKEQKTRAIQEAVSTGDVSAFTDPDSPSYNPEQAVSILRAHSDTEGTAPEVRATNKTKVEEILASLVRETEGDRELLGLNTPENRVAFKKALETNKQELKDNRATMSAEEITAKENTIAAIEGSLLSGKELKELTALNKKNKERIESITQMYESWDTFDNAEGTEVGDLVKVATTEVAVDDTEGITASTSAVNEVINLAMRSPEKLSTSTLEDLVNSPSAQFTDDHRALFSSILQSREATRIAKSSSAVSAEFFEGGNGNVGINQYAENIRTALADDDASTAKAELAKLKSFVDGHAKKVKMMERLLAEFKKTGKQGQMVPVGAKNSGEWAEPAKPMTEAELDAVGGLYIDTRTTKVVKAVRAEADAGLLLYKELNTAGSLNTNSTVAPADDSESVTALVDAASTEQGKASVKSLTSGTRVDAEAYAALKKELSPAQMREVNTLYGKNKKPVTKGTGNETSQIEKKYKKEQAKQVAAAKAAVNKKSAKNKANFAMADSTLINKIESVKKAIKDPAKKEFKETNELILAVYEEALASRKADASTEVTEEVKTTPETPTEVVSESTVEQTSTVTDTTKQPTIDGDTLSDGRKVAEVTPEEVTDSLLKALERVRVIQMSAAEGNSRALEDMDDARSDVTKLLAVADGIGESVKDLYLQILNSDKPLSLEEVNKWVMKHAGPVRSSLFSKITNHLKGNKFNGFTFITSEVDMPTGGKAIPAGLFYTNEKIIGINPLSTYGSPNPNTKSIMVTIMHELIHAAVDELINTDPEFREGVKALQEKVRKFLNSKDSKGLTDKQRSNLEYSVSNEYEYFSTIVSDPEMMNVIDSIKTGTGNSIVTDLILLVVNTLRKTMNLTVPEATLLTDTLVLFSQAIGDAPVSTQPIVYSDDLQQLIDEAFERSEDDYYTGDSDSFSDDIPAWFDEEGSPNTDENGDVVIAETAEELEAIKEANHKELLDMFEEDVALAEAQIAEAEATRLGSNVEVDEMDPEDATQRHESKYLKSTEGKLEFDMTEREGANSAYQGKNLIGHYFMQVANKVGSLVPRPLVAVKDFMQGIIDGTYKYQDFLEDTVTDDQQYLLDMYTEFHIKVRDEVLRLLVQKKDVNADYDYMNPIRYFMKDVDGVYVLDENVVSAFTSTMFSWLGDEGANNEMDTNETIHAKMGLALDENVTIALGELVRTVGLRRTLAMNALGRTFMQSLGFKAANDEVPINLQPQVEGGMGAYMLAVLESLGYTEETSILTREIIAARGMDVEGYFAANPSMDMDKQTEVFVKVRRPAAITPESVGTAPVYEVGSIVEAFKGSHGVMDKLMGVENVGVDPSFRPVEFNADDATEDNQKIPKVITGILDAVGKIKNRINIQSMKVINGIGGMSTEAFETMVGIEEVNESNTHIARRGSLQAKYDGKRREIEHFQNFLKHLNTRSNKWTTPFFLSASYWKNGRAGYTSRIDGQTSKIHRWLVSTGMANTVVSMDDMDNFKLRVLEALDVKTDETPDAISLMEFDTVTGHPTIKAGVEVIQKMIFDGHVATVADQNTIVAAVLKTGNDLHGFSGLMALANMQQAIDNGQTDFNTTLTAEIDGKTNGPMLSMWLLGVMDEKSAEMGGFYSEGNDHKSFSHWKIKGGYDLYQRTAVNVNKNIKFLLGEDPSKQSYFDSLFRITGKYEDDKGVTKTGRQVVKDAINPLTYGSSIGRAVASMADAYIESIYKRMEDITKGKSYGSDAEGNALYGEQAYAALKDDINHLIGYDNSKYKELYSAKTLAEAMETPLNKGQEGSLRTAYSATVGKAVNSTLKADFKDYLKSRKMIIDASNLSFGMYNAAFKATYENVLNDMIESGEIPSRVFKGVREPIHGLTKKQVKEVQARIKKLEPRFNTSISLKDDSEDSLDRGIYSGNMDKTLSNRHSYSTQTKVNGGSALAGKPGVKLKGKSSHGYELILTNPGASIMSMLVQNTDASIMLPQIPKFEGLGVHDALLVALGKSAEAGRALNETTINQLLDYSLARESLQTLERSFIAMAEQIKENPDNANLHKEFDEMLSEMLDNMEPKTRALFGDASEFFSFTLNRMAEEAARADYKRLTGLSKLTVVDQYTIEAGVYQVPQEFRDEAKSRIPSITKTASKEALEAVKILSEYAGGKPTAEVTKPAGKTIPERTTTTHSANESVSTAIGSPNFKADAELEAQLAAGKLNTGAKLVKYLTTKATLSKTDTGMFYSLLLGRIGKLIVKDMKIVYLTKDSKLDIPDGFEGAFGWFNMTDGVPTIYIKSSDFKNSAVSMELAIHELLHAAVAQIIANPTKEVKPIIAELQSMMETTKEHLKDDLATSIRFADALADVQEFVTWGMTNSDFQKILINQKYESRLANKNPLANMAQVFIDAISRLIFGSSKQSNQLSVLFAHVHTLMDASDLKKSGLDISLKANNTVPELEASTLDVFDSLATEAGAVTDPVFKEHLRSLLTNIVDKLHGPYGAIFEAAKANMAVTPLDVWAKAKDTGMLPFRSSLSAAGFNLGEQEAFVAEMIQATMIESMQNNTQPVEQALMKLVREAREAIKVGDLDNDPIVDAAKRKLLFEAPEGDVTGHWRANIIALSLVNKPIADLMMFNTAENTDRPSNTLYGRILNWFNKLLNRLNSGMGKAYGGQKAMDKMEVIANRLVDIQAKRVLEQSRKNTPSYADHAETYLNGVGEKARDMLIKVGKSDILRKHTGAAGRIVGTAMTLSLQKQIGNSMSLIEDYYMEHTEGQLGFIAKLYEEVRGSTDNNEWGTVTLMLTKYNEKIRQDLALHTSQGVMESYVNGGKELDTNTRTAITKVLLRTGSFVLLEDIGMQRLEEVLRDPVELDKEIQNQINKLSGKYADYYRNQSLLLGYYLATGYVKEDNLRMNAHSIARLDGTKADTSILTEQQVAIDTKIIDSLSSLYALKYTGPANNTLIANLMESEGKRGENYNGVEYTLRVHAALTQQSKERIFAGSELLMAKGYIPEIVNPKTELHYDSLLKKEELEEQGYKYVGPVQKDANDVANKNLHMYTLERGLVHRISGTFSTKSTAAAGTAVHTGLVHKATGDEHLKNKRIHDAITKRKEANIAKLFKSRPDLDPSTDIKQYLAPTSDANGNTVNYRYIMGNDTRDLLLERNNDFSTLLGTLASSTFDKHTTTKHNNNVIAALKDQWDKQRVDNPSHYMLVSEKSTDPEVAAAYRMLPWETKQEIKRVFGTDGMHVRRDMYDLHFGYRKYSIADMFGKPSKDRNMLEKYLVKFFTALPWMGPQAALKLRTLEDVIQHIVREIKDILVVKTGVTLFWNVISNVSLLMTYGVGPIDLIKYHTQAYVGITKWTKDTARLNKLELERASGMIIGSSSELDQKITELKEQLARNPVRGLVEAGMQPTIVEDVNMVEDLYSYKSQTMKDIEKYTDKIPSGIKTAAKWVYMSHDTPLYKLLAHGTQVSDFLAKYTLYMKTTQRANNKLSHADAVKLATAAFVNYDLPSHKGLQYMNDMGLVMFTKYYMRIQHAMLHMYQENPARGIGLLLFDSYFSAAQTIADSSFYNNINSPFTVGPLNYYGAFNDGMIMQGIGKLFK